MKYRYLLFALILFFLLPGGASAAFYKFSPQTKTIATGERFTLQIQLDTEGQAPQTADALVLFNSQNLRLVEVIEPGASERFFPKFFKKSLSDNKTYVGGAIEPGISPKSGSGLLGSLVFEGLISGSSQITLACEQGKSTESNISIKRGTKLVEDLLDCSKINSATITIGGVGGGATGTPGLTASPRPSVSTTVTLLPTQKTTTLTLIPSIAMSVAPSLTRTPTPTISLSTTVSPTISTLPSSGQTASTAAFIKIGLILAGVGLIVKLFIIK